MMKRRLFLQSFVILSLLAGLFFLIQPPAANASSGDFLSGEDLQQVDPEGQYQVLKLNELPTPAQRLSLQRLGIRLERWLSGTSYWAWIPTGALSKLSYTDKGGERIYRVAPAVRSSKSLTVSVVAPSWEGKVAPDLLAGDIPEWAIAGPDLWKVVIFYLPGVTPREVESHLMERGCRIQQHIPELRHVRCDMPADVLQAVATPDWVERVYFVSPPPELHNESGAQMLQVREMQQEASLGGLNLRGKGVRVGIFDSDVKPHIDLGDRLHHMEQSEESDHGQHVSGTVAGAGILDPMARGMAPEADIYTWPFSPGQPALKMLRGYLDQGIRITQNSYGAGPRCWARTSYWEDDLVIDMLSLILPKMAHVYSAGNYQQKCAGEDGDLGGYVTSTRQSKNIITVGALYASEEMTDFSSWGPTVDGRLLPLLVAKGKSVYSTVYNNEYGYNSGTSMACPQVSGLTTLLYEHYRKLNAGHDPDFILIKNALINTAHDKGREGPDYQYGFGVPDGVRAAKLLTDKRYAIETIAMGEEKTLDIQVPDGVQALKVALVWHDKEGDKYWNTDLINDLDLTVEFAGKTYHPWVLDPANPTKPATTGIDRLNNQEQVLIKTPAPGTYKIKVKGFTIVDESVSYSLTYDFDYSDLHLAYPTGGELVNSNSNLLFVRWNGGDPNSTLRIDLSTDNGQTWTTKADNIPTSDRIYPLEDLKGIASDVVKLRIVDGKTFAMSETFTMFGRPQGVKAIPAVCSGKPSIAWEEVPGAAEYNILRYDAASNAMVQAASGLTGLVYEIPDGATSESPFYAVEAVLPSGTKSMRSASVVPKFLESNQLTSLPYVEEVGAGYNPRVQILPGKYTDFSRTSVSNTQLVKFSGYGDGWDNSSALFDNPEHIARVRMCLDLTSFSGDNLALDLFSMVFPVRKKSSAAVRLVVNHNPDDPFDSDVLSTVSGQTEIFESGSAYYDLSSYIGQQLILEVQSYIRGATMLLGSPVYDRVFIAPLRFFTASNDMGVQKVIVPDPSATLSAREDVTAIFYSNSNTQVANEAVLYVDDTEIARNPVTIDEPFGETEVIFTADFSEKDHLYEVRVELAKPDDNAKNNVRKATTANLGGCFLMPDKPLSYFDELIKKEVSKATPVRFTDNGASVTDYEPGRHGKVLFFPSNTAKERVKIVFSELELAPGDKLLVYDSDSEKIIYTFDGSITEPVTVISSGKLGKTLGALMVEFIAKSGSSKPGWVAEVTVTEDSEQGAMNNLLTAGRMEIQKVDYTTKKPTVKVFLTNNFNRSLKNVTVQYSVNDGPWVTEVIPNVEAGSTDYTFKEPADLTVWPKKYTITGKIVYPHDVENSDNTFREEVVISDKYVVTRKGSGGYGADDMIITSVGYLDFLRETHATNAGDTYPQFFRAVPIPVYSDRDVVLDVGIYRTKEGAGRIAAWVDWNQNGKFDDDERVALVGIADGLTSVQVPIPIAKTTAAGTYNMRLVVQKGTDDPNLTQTSIGYGSARGEVEDYALKLEKNYPIQVDLGVASIEVNGFSYLEQIGIVLENAGSGDIVNPQYTVKHNGTVVGTYTVSATIPPFSTYTDNQVKIDLIASGSHEIEVSTSLAGDQNPDNNSLTVRKYNSAGLSFVLSFDGQDDLLQVEGWKDDLNTVTYEAWVNLANYGGGESSGFGRIFDGKGILIFTNSIQNGVYPYGVLVVGVGGKNFHTADKLPLNRWVHLAVTYAKDDAAPKLYLNGIETALQPLNADEIESFPAATEPLYIGNSGAKNRPFHGMLDEVRVWRVVRSQTEIADGMEQHATSSPDLLLDIRFDEGPGSATAASTVGDLSGNLINMEVSGIEASAWQPEPEPELLEFSVANQAAPPMKQSDGTWKVNMQSGYTPGTPLIVESQVTNIPNARIPSNLSSTAVTGSVAEYETTLQGGWLGRTKNVRFKIFAEDKGSNACDLLSLNVTQPFNLSVRINPPDATELVERVNVSYRDLEKVQLTYTVSPNATVMYDGAPFNSGDHFNLQQPLVFRVYAQNEYDHKEYSLVLISDDNSISASPASTTLAYGDAPFNMNASATSGLPVSYKSSDESVLQVASNGEVTVVGVGTADIHMYQPGNNSVAAARPSKVSFTVAKRALKIRPQDATIEQTDPIPEFELTYDGFVNGDGPLDLDELPTVSTTATRESAAGDYPITLAGGSDGNYEYQFEQGKLTITAVAVNNVTFHVTYNDNPLDGATIVLDGWEKQSKNGGEALFVLKDGNYAWTCEMTGKEPKNGEIGLSGRDITVDVVMIDPLPTFTLTYTTDGHGTIVGDSVQSVKQGHDGQQVEAKPKTGYEFVKWEDNDRTNPVRTDYNVQGDIFAKAIFQKKTFTLVYDPGTYGKIKSGETPQEVEYLENATPVEVAPEDPEYIFIGWDDGVMDNPRKDLQVTASKTVTALWARVYTLPYTQDFSGLSLQQPMPKDWTTVDQAGTGSLWSFKNLSKHYSAPTWDAAAIADIYEHGYGKAFDADLVSPLFDLSAYTKVTLKFKYYLHNNTNSLSPTEMILYALVDGSWVKLFSANQNMTAAAEFSQDISQVVGKSRVRFKWQAKSRGDFTAVYVDDVEITGIDPTGEYTLTYNAGLNGHLTVNGKDVQTYDTTLLALNDGPSVLAVADDGFNFDRWSDGSTQNPRVDNAVMDINVEAIFARDCSQPVKSYPYVQNFDGTPADDCWEIAGDWQYGVEREIGTTGNHAYIKPNYSQTTNKKGTLYSPLFDLSGLTSPHLSFIHYFMPSFGTEGVQTGEIFYTQDGGKTWTSLKKYSTNFAVDQVVLPLNLVGSTTSVRFKFDFDGAKWANGWLIDDFTITDGAPATLHSVRYLVQESTAYPPTNLGVLTGSGTQWVIDGENAATVSVEPISGYTFVGWDDGVLANPRTDRNVRATIYVEALFSKAYTLTITDPEHGAITVKWKGRELVSGANIGENEQLEISATPDPGYMLQSLKVNSTDFTSGNWHTVAGHVKVEATFVTLPTYTLTITPPTDGTIEVKRGGDVLGDGATLTHGDELTISATPASGKALLTLTVNTEDFASGGVHTVGGNVTVAATFGDAPATGYTLSITPPTNGSISVMRGTTPLGDTDPISHNDVLTISADPLGGYVLKSLKVNGTEFVSGHEYTVIGDVSVVATFEPEPTYRLTILGETNGYVEVKRGGVKLEDGATLKTDDELVITAKPDPKYRLKSLRLGGVDFESGMTHTVKGEVTIAVEFEPIPTYKLSITSPTGGTIEVKRGSETLDNDAVLTLDDELTISASAADGYIFRGLKVNGNTFISGDTHTVKGDVTVTALFEKTYMLTITPPQNGSIAISRNGAPLSGGETLYRDDELIITATADDGFTLKTLTVNGSNFTSGGTHVVAGDVVVEATFELPPAPSTYMLTITPPENGTIAVTRGGTTLSSGDVLAENDELTITATAADGYELKSLTVNGADFASGETYVVKNDVTIAATFAEKAPVASYKLTITPPENGTIAVLRGADTLADGAALQAGDKLVITATPQDGFVLDKLIVNGVDFASGDTFEVADDVTVAAAFAEKAPVAPYKLTITPPAGGEIAVLRGTDTLADGAGLQAGDRLVIMATPQDGFILDNLTVNGADFTSGDTLEVAGDVTVAATFVDPTTLTYKLTIVSSTEGTIKVTRDNVELMDGALLKWGEKLTIIATPKEKYELEYILVNGQKSASGSTYIVNGNVIVSAQFKFIGGGTAVESSLFAGVEIFPNPANSVLHLRHVEQVETIRILTIAGAPVLTLPHDGAAEASVDVSQLPEGAYLLFLQRGAERRIEKIIVAH